MITQAAVSHNFRYPVRTGYPVEVERRDATQMNPYAMNVTRNLAQTRQMHSGITLEQLPSELLQHPGIRATPVDTASVATALHSEQPVVPPEGGKTVEVHRLADHRWAEFNEFDE